MLQLNLVGIIFHISESASQKLKMYRAGLYKYFASKQDGEEILADLEYHMAEIFWEATEANARAIENSTVDAMIARMGNVADFEEAEQNPAYKLSFEEDAPPTLPAHRTAIETTLPARTKLAFTPYSEEVWGLPTHAHREPPQRYEQISPKRLYRDSKRAMLGGVAAGFAHYFQIEVVWVRLLFLTVFFGFIPTPFATGTLVLIYILLWVALPQSEHLPEVEVKKRLHRTLQDAQISGVCAGIARYFDWQRQKVRIAFMLSAFTGIGLIIYVVLWAIVPKSNEI